MNASDFTNIPKEKLNFVQQDGAIHDQKFETKAIGYFKDAWYRFSRNKGSVVAAVIIGLLLVFAILVPMFSRFNVKYKDGYYAYTMPKNNFLSQYGILTGNKDYTYNQQSFDYYNAIPGAVVEVKDSYEIEDSGRVNTYYDMTIDTYKKVGYVYKYLTLDEYQKALKYQEETGIRLLYPMINTKKIQLEANKTDPNYWFEHTMKGNAVYDENGNYKDIFLRSEETEDGYVYYTEKMNGEQYQVRVLYYDWYTYENGFEPYFLFGTDGYGRDILVCLASGARLSFILGILVSVLNFLIGTCYGAVEGYYGGKIDLYLERLSDILGYIPFIVVAVLFQIYLVRKIGAVPTLIVAFLFNGWIGIASRVRSQFYRFKGQEYVLAARTLGAKDRTLIFRHILPNALGTIVTSAVLMIPGVIFSESTLSYLGVVNLETSSITSVGAMLSNGNSALSTFPHVIFFPAVYISLLMICFNMFGNGLRDALNPSLRGTEE